MKLEPYTISVTIVSETENVLRPIIVQILCRVETSLFSFILIKDCNGRKRFIMLNGKKEKHGMIPRRERTKSKAQAADNAERVGC